MDILAYVVAVLIFGILGGSIILSAKALYDIRDSIYSIEYNLFFEEDDDDD